MVGDEHIKDYIQEIRKRLRKTWMDGPEHSEQHEVTFTKSDSVLKKVSSKHT